MRLAFMGTPDFALVALKALHAAGHDITAVYCQPPRPAGRGKKPRPGPVQGWAGARGLTVRTPASFKDPAECAAFAALDADVAVVAAYGLILPQTVLSAPTYGCLNIHASLLPRWRGAAPIQRAIEAGDTETGVTLMQMTRGLDTGPMILSDRIEITPGTNAGNLQGALALTGARLMLESLEILAVRKALNADPQPETGVTYAAKIDKTEAVLDFSLPAAVLERRIRAFNPFPGAVLIHGKDRIKILEAELVDSTVPAAPGEILDEKLLIACGKGALRPRILQRAGKAAMALENFLRGYHKLPVRSVIQSAALEN